MTTSKKPTKTTPPKSVQRELDAVAAAKRKDKKRKQSRGPASVRPVGTVSKTNTVPKLRDEDRIFNLVETILETFKAQEEANNPIAQTPVIKINRKQIELALMGMKNTRRSRIFDLINQTMGESIDLTERFGSWVMVEHDYPFWVFNRLPKDETEVFCFNIIKERNGADAQYHLDWSSEQLMPTFSEEDEEEEIDAVYCEEDEDEEYAEEEEGENEK